jgi:hypothetical protein
VRTLASHRSSKIAAAPFPPRGSAVVQAMTFDGADSCPSRSAAAVAEQQCHETLRGGRT